ncbi:DUF4238 domain-containing protein [Pedobacter frigidisoli]|uniref:DUF4238 domain-containing protein n=1 Tax=Pedobacter frigidisoli TaxID=2530455 RepID=UPI00292F4F5B|nr:DUF4238 domain-containing protein [Pedobacter frigidisoli]
MAKQRHHYISNFLCKHFSADNISFYRHDNKDGKIIPISTKDGYVQKHLYRLRKKDGTYDDRMEDIFSDYYEKPASIAIASLIERLKRGTVETLLTTKEFLAILNFCILSHIRTPNKLNEIYLSQVRLILTITYMELKLHNIPLDIDFSVNLNREMIFLETIKSIPAITKKLFNLSIHVFYHRSDQHYFVLPDQPVALYPNDDREFGSKNLQIYFPVSSSILIRFERGPHTDTLTELRADQIDEFNQMACSRHYRYIACENKEYLENFVRNTKLTSEPVQSDESLEQDKKDIIEQVIHTLDNTASTSTILVNSRHGVQLAKTLPFTKSGIKKFWKQLLKKIWK